jgi:hypothetical protein
MTEDSGIVSELFPVGCRALLLLILQLTPKLLLGGLGYLETEAESNW